jgi:SAM-dependent methyltransferase
LDKADIETRKLELEREYGSWTSHNLQLRDDLYTIGPGVAGGTEARLRRIVQMAADLAGPIDRLRVLDLGALEGLFAVELARRGATVVAIEGRRANYEKLRLARDALELDELELRLEDVRDLRLERHGEFDLVLCLGLLYHLDAPDVFALLSRMHEVCRRLVIVDTRIALHAVDPYDHQGHRYWGQFADEPSAATDPRSRDALWSSIGNPRSFHLTRISLCNALADHGYSSVFECHLPPHPGKRPFRVTLAAFTLGREDILSVPAANEQPWSRSAELPTPLGVKLARSAMYLRLWTLVPAPLKAIWRRGKRLFERP